MTVDIENQKQPLVKLAKMQLKWDTVAQIIADDDNHKLQALLEQDSLELVARPEDAKNNRTALHEAVDRKASACLQTILDWNPSQEILNAPDDDGCTPLHVAVSCLNSSAVKSLIDAGANPNARNNQGHTALHVLAYSAKNATTSETLTGVLKCTDFLLDAFDTDLEAVNNSKVTPLRAAAGKFPTRASSLEEFCKKLVNRGAVIDEFTKNVFEKHTIPKIVSPSESNNVQPRALYAQLTQFLILDKSGNIPELFKGQRKEELRLVSNSYIGSKKVLYYVVDRCDVEGVKALLAAGADPWAYNLNGELPLHRALARANIAIVNSLIGTMKRKSKPEVVDLRHKSFSLLKVFLHNNASGSETSIKCLKRLFDKDVLLDVNQKDMGLINQSALHIAGAMNNQDAMAVLLEHGAYLGEHRIINGIDNGNVLQTVMPKTLSKAMDNCIHPRNNADESTDDDLLNPDYTLVLKYGFLIPPFNGDSKIPEVHNEAALLFEVSQCKEHQDSIKHPLIQTLLYAKWRKVLPLYVFNLFLYSSFVVLLTFFLYTLKNLRILQRMDRTGNVTDQIGLKEQIAEYQTSRGVLMTFILLITLYMVTKEVFQIVFTKKGYFKYIENYLEWFLIIAVFVVCFIPLSVDCTKHLAAWAMVVAWYEFVLVLGRAPPLAIYITMLRHVSWNFLKLVFLFGFLIIAFSISFNIILQPSRDLESGSNFSDFSAFWTTVPRAVVMATGEFEYSSISEELSPTVIFATSTVLIFLVFLFLIFLVLMNVMTGLAVTDAKSLGKPKFFTQLSENRTEKLLMHSEEIVEDAILYSLKSRLELVYLNEQLFLKLRFLRRLLPKLQLLEGKDRKLLVKVNKLPKRDRITYGERQKTCKLDNSTATVLRNHRLNKIAEEKAEKEGNPVEKIFEMLQEIRSKITKEP